MSVINLMKKNVISSEIVNERGISNDLAEVTKSKPQSGVCDITYIDEYGKKVTKKDVPVRMSSPTFIDWFPEKKEKVTIMAPNDSPIIIGPSDYDIANKNRSTSKLTNDIYSDNISDEAEGGFIF